MLILKKCVTQQTFLYPLNNFANSSFDRIKIHHQITNMCRLHIIKDTIYVKHAKKRITLATLVNYSN